MTNTTTIHCQAVRANIDNANPTWQGVIECREKTARGTRKLWRKRCGQKMARLTYSDAMIDALNYAQEVAQQNNTNMIYVVHA